MSGLKRHGARFSAAIWGRIIRIAERLNVPSANVLRALVEHALDEAEEPGNVDVGAFALDARILGATAKVGSPKRRYLEAPIVAELLAAVRTFDAEASEANGETWRKFGLGLRQFAVRFERHGNRLDEAKPPPAPAPIRAEDNTTAGDWQ